MDINLIEYLNNNKEKFEGYTLINEDSNYNSISS
jgi:hypothetical protein